MLRDTDTPIDLMLRGFGRDAVLTRTGVDIGYNGRALREEAQGTDRTAYKIEHVRRRVSEADVDRTLELCEQGATKEAVLAQLGLAGTTTIMMRTIFEGIGLTERFDVVEAACRQRRLREGMVAKHGVANPFELAEVQERAAQTRTERYGAPYTLAEGSALAETARETFAEHMGDEAFAGDVRAKRAATNQERRGVDAPSQDPAVRAKMRATREARRREP